jgi:predicted nucleic acid-binding protein
VSAPRRAFVIDATIVIKWFFEDEDHTREADAILVGYRQGLIDLIAPDHLYHEALNSLRTGVRMRRLTIESARGTMRDFLSLSIPTTAGPALYERGFEYALHYDCAFYDALYLALADHAGCPFVHADRRLRNTLAGRFPREVWIEDYK